MLSKLFKLLGLKETHYPSYINCAYFKCDRLPNPTKEDSGIKKIPTECIEIAARNWLAWLILRKYLYRRLPEYGHALKALLSKERCLEIYPLPAERV